MNEKDEYEKLGRWYEKNHTSETVEEALRKAEKVYFIMEYQSKDVLEEVMKLEYFEHIPALSNLVNYRKELMEFLVKSDRAYDALVKLGVIK